MENYSTYYCGVTVNMSDEELIDLLIEYLRRAVPKADFDFSGFAAYRLGHEVSNNDVNMVNNELAQIVWQTRTAEAYDAIEEEVDNIELELNRKEDGVDVSFKDIQRLVSVGVKIEESIAKSDADRPLLIWNNGQYRLVSNAEFLKLVKRLKH